MIDSDVMVDTGLKVTLSRDALAEKLSLVSRAVSARTAVLVLGGIQLRAADGQLHLAATDMLTISTKHRSGSCPCLAGPRGSGASIFPAVQNMLLAARAVGLGATLTTLYLMHEKESEAAMGIPEGQHSYAILPIGFPTGKFGPVRRAPLAEVAFEDRWGQAWHAE